MSEQRQRGEWGHTTVAKERLRLKGKGFYEEKGFTREAWSQGRRVIHRDTPINKGIYPGGSEREAIVVDDAKDDGFLEETYRELLDKFDQNDPNASKMKLLNDILTLTQKKIPYDATNVNIVRARRNIGPDQKISLSQFEGGGICRHQALLAGYMVERLIHNGMLNGHVSIDRNETPEGGHAWVRYTSSSGEVIIIDPAQLDSVFTLDELTSQDDRWFYERPEDVDRFKKKIHELTLALKKIARKLPGFKPPLRP